MSARKEPSEKAIRVVVHLSPQAYAALEKIAAGHSFRTNLSAAVERLIFDECKRQAQPLAHAPDCACHGCTYVGIGAHVKGCRCDLCKGRLFAEAAGFFEPSEPKGIE